MHKINATFSLLSELSITSLLGKFGVYIIWDSQSRVRPTYIGEGKIIQRIVEHEQRFAQPMDGYAAVLSRDGISWQRAKADGKIVESLLLYIAGKTDRKPAVNQKPGEKKSLKDIFELHGVLNVAIRGRDPFQHPRSSRILGSSRNIRVTQTRDGSFEADHPWKMRRVMKKG